MQTDSINRLNKIKSYQLKSFKSYLIGKELFQKFSLSPQISCFHGTKNEETLNGKLHFFVQSLWTAMDNIVCTYYEILADVSISQLTYWKFIFMSAIVDLSSWKKDLTVDDFRWDNKNCLFFASMCYQAYQQINNFLCMIYFS